MIFLGWFIYSTLLTTLISSNKMVRSIGFWHVRLYNILTGIILLFSDLDAFYLLPGLSFSRAYQNYLDKVVRLTSLTLLGLRKVFSDFSSFDYDVNCGIFQNWLLCVWRFFFSVSLYLKNILKFCQIQLYRFIC